MGQDAAPDQVEWVIARMTELELLDDQKFASQFTEDKRRLAGWGSERIERTLVERGIPREMAARAVRSEAGAELERAIAILVGRGEDLEEPGGRQRALGLLARRGFSSDDAYEAIRRVRRLGEEAHGSGGDVAPDGLRSR